MLTGLHRSLAAITAAGTAESAIYGARPRHRLDQRPPPGAGFYCPVCEGWSRTFLPFGLARRRRAACPRCGSLERHRFTWVFLRDVWHIQQLRGRVLHIAPEPCIRARLASSPWLRLLTADRFDPEADVALDVTRLALPSGRFDAVLCSHVLEHVLDDRGAMAEIARVLRPGGRAMLMVPIDMSMAQTYEDPAIDTPQARNRAFGHPFHVRIPGADYPDRIRGAGLDVTVVGSAEIMTPHRRRQMRINTSVLFDCRKPADAR